MFILLASWRWCPRWFWRQLVQEVVSDRVFLLHLLPLRNINSSNSNSKHSNSKHSNIRNTCSHQMLRGPKPSMLLPDFSVSSSFVHRLLSRQPSTVSGNTNLNVFNDTHFIQHTFAFALFESLDSSYIIFTTVFCCNIPQTGWHFGD
jgi:hypothetical protein